MENINLEIRASEGGEDSKLLVIDMMNIYIKTANLNSYNWKINEIRDGFVNIWLSGKGVKSIFQNEIGSHRWQRVPPTEKRGRVHTSTITVALIEIDNYKEVEIPYYEYSVETTRGTGNGGQHKNSTDSCVIMTHYHTGIKVVRDGRSQLSNREDAYKELKKRLNEFYKTGHLNKEAENRREQIGNGFRGDKRRTYREKDGIVIDHITNKQCSFKDIFKGKIELLK